MGMTHFLMNRQRLRMSGRSGWRCTIFAAQSRDPTNSASESLVQSRRLTWCGSVERNDMNCPHCGKDHGDDEQEIARVHERMALARKYFRKGKWRDPKAKEQYDLLVLETIRYVKQQTGFDLGKRGVK